MMIRDERQEKIGTVVVDALLDGENVLLVGAKEKKLSETSIKLTELSGDTWIALFMSGTLVEKYAKRNELIGNENVMCFPYSEYALTDTWAITGLASQKTRLSAICPNEDVEVAIMDAWMTEDVSGLLAIKDTSAEEVVNRIYEEWRTGEEDTGDFVAQLLKYVAVVDSEGGFSEVYTVEMKDGKLVVERMEV